MDYHSILGVDYSATKEEIKRAYKKLASKHHPDKGGDEAEFKKVQEAYEVLSNPDKHFNNYGPDAAPHSAREYGAWNSFFNDMFTQQRPNGNPDSIMELKLSLYDVLTGKQLVINTPQGPESLTVNPGVRDGTRYVMRNKGLQRVKQYAPGDLIIEVRTEVPAGWAREDETLYVRLGLDSLDAVTGTTSEIKHVNNKSYNIKIPPGCQDGQHVRLRGLGLTHPQTGIAGDLIVVTKINVPIIEDEEILKLLNTIKELRGSNG